MSRAVIFIFIFLIIIAGLLVLLSSQAGEVPTQPTEIDITNETAR